MFPSYRLWSRPIPKHNTNSVLVLAREATNTRSISWRMETSLLFQKFAPQCLAVLALAFLPLVLTYLTALLNLVITYKKWKSGVSPPTAPYWIPWIGHAWPFILSLTLLALSVRYDLTISWHAGDLWLY